MLLLFLKCTLILFRCLFDDVLMVKILGLPFPGAYSEREGYKGSEYAPTYEDKDGDWMLVGDVPWE